MKRLLTLIPAVAIAVGLNIVVTGVGLVRQSVSGLMDAAWPDAVRMAATPPSIAAIFAATASLVGFWRRV